MGNHAYSTTLSTSKWIQPLIDWAMSNNDQRDNWTMALDCHDHECRFWILNCFCAYPLNGVLRLCSQTGEMLWENFSGSNSQGDNVLHSDNYKNNAQHLFLQKWEFLGEFLATFGRSLKWHGRNIGRQLFCGRQCNSYFGDAHCWDVSTVTK